MGGQDTKSELDRLLPSFSIEAQFGVLKRFTLARTDDRSHAERRRRIYRYLRWRDRQLGTLQHPLQRLRSISLNKFEHHYPYA